MSLLEKQFIFNKNVTKLAEFLENNNIAYKRGEVLRTKEQQQIYINQGKSSTYNSQHINGLAIDINLFRKDKNGKWEFVNDVDFYKKAGDYWKSLNGNNRWGGDWKSPVDPYHFEMRD